MTNLFARRACCVFAILTLASAASAATLSTIVTFDRTNGYEPYGTLIADAAGNLYGTTDAGGPVDDGTVFKVAAGTNVLTTLANFFDHNVSRSNASLVADASGNLYGTTSSGGTGAPCSD